MFSKISSSLFIKNIIRVTQLFLFSGAVLLALSVRAHHGPAVKFDTQVPVTLNGRVTKVDWSNPHAHIFMVVENGEENGSENGSRDWYVELPSPVVLEWNGWSENSLLPGVTISVEGYPARDGSPQVWGERVLQGNARLFTGEVSALSLAQEVVQDRSVPRHDDGLPRLGAVPNEEGYWVPDTTVMMETGVDVAMTAYGLLENIADAPRVAPLQDWALKLYEFRQSTFLQSDPGFIECRPPAGPRKFQAPFGIQLLEDKAWQRIFVVAGGGNQDWHLIYTDGRNVNSGFPVDNDNILYYGRNVAHWEGDTLLINSEGYNEKFWLSGGLPHTSLMKVTEKLTRSDFNTLHYEVEINDPGAYTRPWSMSWNLVWLEGGDPPEYYCQDNRL